MKCKNVNMNGPRKHEKQTKKLRPITPCNKITDIYCTTPIFVTQNMLQTTPFPEHRLWKQAACSISCFHKPFMKKWYEISLSFPSESPKQPYSCLRGKSSSQWGRPRWGSSPVGWLLFSNAANSRARKKEGKRKGKMMKQDTEGKYVFLPPSRCYAVSRAANANITKNQNIRLINFHSHTRCTKRTIPPCWNTEAHTHTHPSCQA